MKKSSILEYLGAIDPAAIIVAGIIEPGSVTSMSVLGANYRYQGVWVVTIAAILAYFYQEASLRLTIAKRKLL